MAANLPQVLYVEDDRINRLLMAKIFTQANDMRFIMVENGGQALDVAETDDIDVVITDIRLPGINSFDKLVALRSSPKNREVPVIALSALAMVGDLERGRRAGFAAYIT